jgi:hypothetical protein
LIHTSFTAPHASYSYWRSAAVITVHISTQDTSLSCVDWTFCYLTSQVLYTRKDMVWDWGQVTGRVVWFFTKRIDLT